MMTTFIKRLAINLTIALILLSIILYFTLEYLDKKTLHGQYIEVPNLYGMNPQDANEMAEYKKLTSLVIDSIFDKSNKPGVVIDQYPRAGERVKNRREIRLTINAKMAESIPFPNIKNNSFRQAIQVLESQGFVVGTIQYRASEFKNLVLALISDSVEIEAGTRITKGSTIDIVLGSDGSPNMVFLPNINGKRVSEAVQLIKNSLLNVGEIITDETIRSKADSIGAYVYFQIPEYEENLKIEAGRPVSIYISLEREKIIDRDSLLENREGIVSEL